MIEADGVELCTESFGRLLAEGGRFVIRHDHRDTGPPVTHKPGDPKHTGADLIADAVGVLDAYGIAAACVFRSPA